MTLWHAEVIRRMRESGLFVSVQLSGGKVRAVLSETRFVDIHFDPTSRGYSYALIDLTLPYPGDKRIFGWMIIPTQARLNWPGFPAPHIIFKNACQMVTGSLLNQHFAGQLIRKLWKCSLCLANICAGRGKC